MSFAPLPLRRFFRLPITAAFVVSIAAMCALAFAWPFAVSADPSDPIYRAAAISALLLFFASLIALLAARIAQRAKRPTRPG